MTVAGNTAATKAVARGTQSFVGTLSACWRRPSLVGLEVLWRWLFGIPALWLIATKLRAVVANATGGKVLPGALHVAVWLAPVLLVVWVVVSSLGRTAVLRRVDPRLQATLATVMGLQAIRMGALAAAFIVWFWLMGWSARTAVSGPIASGMEPNLVLYCALVIVITLGQFIAWSTVSWWFGMAPLLAMLRGTGVMASLRDAGALRGLKGQLVEINLVLGIVKIALLVLAMVFSATPLPFQSVTTPEFLAWWWAGVAVLYLVGSDFFHVARLVSYLALWRAEDGEK